jgi:hypothetical protein
MVLGVLVTRDLILVCIFQLRIILNKSDSIDPTQLVRVHGALMFSLGKALSCPEVPKVYIGSFWERPYINTEHRKTFDTDHEGLIKVQQGSLIERDG